MAPPQFNSSEEFFSHIQQLDEEGRQRLVADLFTKTLSLCAERKQTSQDLVAHQRQQIESNAVIGELRQEIALAHKNTSEISRSSAEDSFRLAEAERCVEDLRKQLSEHPESCSTSNGKSKSELFRIDAKFTGTDKSLYPSFQCQIQIALAQNYGRYESLQSQISLIYQNLGSGPQSFLERYLTDESLFKFDSLRALREVLDISYKNLIEEEEAREDMNNLRQANWPFGWYLAQFQRLHNLSGMSDNKTLISCMRNGVSIEMRTCISQYQDIYKRYTFDAYVALCKECVVRLDLERPLRPRISNSTSQDPNLRPSARLVTHPTSVASGANVVPLGGDPMILDQTNMSHIGPDGHITLEERQRRFDLNLCMRCGRPRHWAETCNPKQKKGISKFIWEINLVEENEENPDLNGPSYLKE